MYTPAQLYKLMIFESPTIYKTAWDCMKSIFFDTSHDFYFDKNGNLCTDLTFNDRSSINRSGLFIFEQLVSQSAEQLSSKFMDAHSVYKKQVIDLKFQTLLFNFIEKHIDFIVSTPKSFTDELDPCVHDLKTFYSNSLFWSVPRNVSPLWLQEFNHVARIIKEVLWNAFGNSMYKDCPEMRNAWERADAYGTYMNVCSKLKQVTQQVSR